VKEPGSATSNLEGKTYLKSSQRQYSVDSYTGGTKFSKKLNLNKTPDKIWVQGQVDSPSKVETPLRKEGAFDDSPSPGPAMFEGDSPQKEPINITSF
jgi:hypothetical protein